MKLHMIAAVGLTAMALSLSACGKKEETAPAADAATADAAATAPADAMAATPPAADSMAATPPAEGSMTATPPADAMATPPATTAPQTETAPNGGAIPPK